MIELSYLSADGEMPPKRLLDGGARMGAGWWQSNCGGGSVCVGGCRVIKGGSPCVQKLLPHPTRHRPTCEGWYCNEMRGGGGKGELCSR